MSYPVLRSDSFVSSSCSGRGSSLLFVVVVVRLLFSPIVVVVVSVSASSSATAGVAATASVATSDGTGIPASRSRARAATTTSGLLLFLDVERFARGGLELVLFDGLFGGLGGGEFNQRECLRVKRV